MAGKEGSVAAALAPAGWVALLQIHTSVSAWSTSCILGLILGKLLSYCHENFIHVHCSLRRRLHEQQTVVICIGLCFLK